MLEAALDAMAAAAEETESRARATGNASKANTGPSFAPHVLLHTNCVRLPADRFQHFWYEPEQLRMRVRVWCHGLPPVHVAYAQVLPSFRGSGIGRRMVEIALAWSRQQYVAEGAGTNGDPPAAAPAFPPKLRMTIFEWNMPALRSVHGE